MTGLQSLIVLRMGLTFGMPNEPVRGIIDSLTLTPAAKAGLWLLHDFFEESHAISQNLHTPEGSYWHGILHRREPDPSNAKYWFRRAGDHPIMKQLREQSPDLGYNYSSACAFVEDCERGGESVRAVQFLEWRLLFEFCCR